MRHGGQILIDQLRIQGCDMTFCVPGESYLAALDGLHEADIRTIICRQEGGAAMMAEAYGKMTGRPGVAFVTRGPGATNASIGVHIARQDSTPMILFVGQAAMDMQDREAFQEVDFPAMFGPLAKWAAEIRDVRRIPEYVSRAYHTALAGRPGPVVLSLPEDMLSADADVPDLKPAQSAEAHPGADQMRAVGEALRQARKPLLLVGGSGWSPYVQAQVSDFAERFDLPVTTAFRFQDSIDNRHRCYAGHVALGIDPKLARRVKDTDLLLVVGPRLGEITTGGYTLLDVPNPKPLLIHVHPGAEELGSVYRPDIAIQASLHAFAAGLAGLEAPADPPWREWTRQARADYDAFSEPEETPGDVKLEQVVRTVSETVPDDAIVTNGAGNFAAWVHRYFSYRRFRSQVAPTAGAMGYGLPAAVGAKLAAPERPVICFQGDGCFMMNAQELATAVQHELAIVVIVVNNGMYGTIRMHQERHYPGRVSGTSLRNPDFAAFARSFGATGEVVEKTEDFAAAFERALKAGGPALIELKIDPEALTPRQTLSEIRAAAESAAQG